MQFYNPGDPKRGHGKLPPPPKYASGLSDSSLLDAVVVRNADLHTVLRSKPSVKQFQGFASFRGIVEIYGRGVQHFTITNIWSNSRGTGSSFVFRLFSTNNFLISRQGYQYSISKHLS